MDGARPVRSPFRTCKTKPIRPARLTTACLRAPIRDFGCAGRRDVRWGSFWLVFSSSLWIDITPCGGGAAYRVFRLQAIRSYDCVVSCKYLRRFFSMVVNTIRNLVRRGPLLAPPSVARQPPSYISRSSSFRGHRPAAINTIRKATPAHRLSIIYRHLGLRFPTHFSTYEATLGVSSAPLPESCSPGKLKCGAWLSCLCWLYGGPTCVWVGEPELLEGRSDRRVGE